MIEPAQRFRAPFTLLCLTMIALFAGCRGQEPDMLHPKNLGEASNPLLPTLAAAPRTVDTGFGEGSRATIHQRDEEIEDAPAAASTQPRESNGPSIMDKIKGSGGSLLGGLFGGGNNDDAGGESDE